MAFEPNYGCDCDTTDKKGGECLVFKLNANLKAEVCTVVNGKLRPSLLSNGESLMIFADVAEARKYILPACKKESDKKKYYIYNLKQ